MVHGVDDIDAATNADAAASEECRQHVPGGFTQHGIRPNKRQVRLTISPVTQPPPGECCGD